MPIGSKEFALLCACAGTNLSSQRLARISEAARAPLDWNEFLRLADAHGLLPLAAFNLARLEDSLPLAVRQSLHQTRQETTRRGLWFAAELARILDRFQSRNLQSIPYKGPSLAETAYGDVGLRNFSDLDFLISPADYQKACDILAELDYAPSIAWDAAVERFWLKYGYEAAFDGRGGKYLVELQWAALPHYYAVNLRVDDLFARSTTISIGDHTTPSFSPEDSLLVLSLHAAKHLWSRLIWTADIAQIMRRQTIDNSVVIERARALGISRMVGVTVWLAWKLFEVELGAALQALLENDSEIEAIGNLILDRLARGAVYDFESPEYFLLIRRLRERFTDRCRFIWRLVWIPGFGDLAAVRLLEAWFPLYRVVRLGRLIRKLFR